MEKARTRATKTPRTRSQTCEFARHSRVAAPILSSRPPTVTDMQHVPSEPPAAARSRRSQHASSRLLPRRTRAARVPCPGCARSVLPVRTLILRSVWVLSALRRTAAGPLPQDSPGRSRTLLCPVRRPQDTLTFYCSTTPFATPGMWYTRTQVRGPGITSAHSAASRRKRHGGLWQSRPHSTLHSGSFCAGGRTALHTPALALDPCGPRAVAAHAPPRPCAAARCP